MRTGTASQALLGSMAGSRGFFLPHHLLRSDYKPG